MNLTDEMTKLRRMLLTMGATVEHRVDRVLLALSDQDFDAARTVRHGDREVDEMELDIEEECLNILALTQPVASDLRMILATLRINSDLERIADLAKNIAKRLLGLEQAPAFRPPPALHEMAKLTRESLRRTLAALADDDDDACDAIRRDDQRINELNREILLWAHAEIPQHVEATRGAIEVISISRAMERIGDLATNIAEDVIFVVRGTVVRHTRAS